MPNVTREALRLNVLFRRAQLGLSQVEVAKRARLSRRSIVSIELAVGNPTIDTIERIAGVLGTTPIRLLTPRRDGSSDADVVRRAAASAEEFVDVDALIAAIDERDGAAGSPEAAKRRVGKPNRRVPA